MLLDIVGVGFGLLAMHRALGNLNVLLASQGICRNTSEWNSGGCDLEQGDFPKFDIVFESNDRRGKHERIAGRFSRGCRVERVGGDECTHAFSIPDDFSFRVAFFDQLGKGIQVGIPLRGITDIAATLVNGIAALAAEFVGVYSGVGLALNEVVSEIGVIDGCTTKTVNPDDDDVLIQMIAFPSAVSKGFAIFFRWHTVVSRRTTVEGGEHQT